MASEEQWKDLESDLAEDFAMRLQEPNPAPEKDEHLEVAAELAAAAVVIVRRVGWTPC